MQCTHILSNGLRTCKAWLNARLGVAGLLKEPMPIYRIKDTERQSYHIYTSDGFVR
jgi:hypothetical protein